MERAVAAPQLGPYLNNSLDIELGGGSRDRGKKTLKKKPIKKHKSTKRYKEHK